MTHTSQKCGIADECPLFTRTHARARARTHTPHAQTIRGQHAGTDDRQARAGSSRSVIAASVGKQVHTRRAFLSQLRRHDYRHLCTILTIFPGTGPSPRRILTTHVSTRSTAS
jgi:hypothetical protein